MSIAERVAALREWMQRGNVAAVVVPTSDPHSSEYISDHWKIREWLTGFTGSAGTAVVTCGDALLWTDSRYWLQAEEQLSATPFELIREGAPDAPAVADWLAAHLSCDEKIYCVGRMLSLAESRALIPMGRAIEAGADVFSSLWPSRPAITHRPLRIQDARFTGRTAAEKLAWLRQRVGSALLENSVFLVSDLSEIAWLLNLRGSDIDYNPVFHSFLLVAEEEATLYVDKQQLSASIVEHLQAAGVATSGYEDIYIDVPKLAGQGKRVLTTEDINLTLHSLTRQSGGRVQLVPSYISEERMVKDSAEQVGFREAMQRDGVALVRFRRWLDEAVGTCRLTEMDIERALTRFRSEQPGFESPSFATIAAYAAHGAIVHYEATPETNSALQRRGLLLLDSGAQYDCGTTDITRTIPLGPLTDEERHVYTLVLKGHIALSRMAFPEGTLGLQLDTAARAAMWRAGYDFGHGTGHGVGSHLCVHEGPHQIRKNLRACTEVGFKAGMVVTDEPGIYVAGRFGVRIENVLIAQPYMENGFGRFLHFEPLTLCPIDKAPIDFSLLSREETDWLNGYHAHVRRELLPLLADEGDQRYLLDATEPV